MSLAEKSENRSINPLSLVLILSFVFFLLFVGVSGLVYFSRTYSAFKTGAVGLLEVKGMILDSKKTLEKLENFETDERIRAVVIQLNSPGGAVAPSQEIYEAVKKYPKPVVISMSSVAASGAFYIAMGSKKIFANSGSLTGSIGVIMQFANLEKLYEWAKVHRYAIKTGKFKDSGADYRGMSFEEKQLFQEMANDILDQFKAAIVESRKLSMKKLSEIADGRVFSGKQAKKLGLIDELGTLQDAIEEAAKMAGISGKPEVIEAKKKKKDLMGLLLEGSLKDDPESRSSVSIFQTVLERLVLSVLGLNSSVSLQQSEDVTPGVYLLWGQR